MKRNNSGSHSFVSTMHGDGLKGRKKGSRTSLSFPLKLHLLLNTAHDEGLETIVSWLPEGDGFKVHNVEQFVTNILPRFFSKQTKYKSFQRQLNLWEFDRITRGPMKAGYTHPKFQRSEPLLCSGMMRQKRNVGGPSPAEGLPYTSCSSDESTSSSSCCWAAINKDREWNQKNSDEETSQGQPIHVISLSARNENSTFQPWPKSSDSCLHHVFPEKVHKHTNCSNRDAPATPHGGTMVPVSEHAPFEKQMMLKHYGHSPRQVASHGYRDSAASFEIFEHDDTFEPIPIHEWWIDDKETTFGCLDGLFT